MTTVCSRLPPGSDEAAAVASSLPLLGIGTVAAAAAAAGRRRCRRIGA
jgi:hypothetical protein